MIVLFRDLSDDNLKYLSSEQALADLATFHEYFNNKYQISEQTKWISFGGSYSGYSNHSSFFFWFAQIILFQVHYQHGFV